MQIPILKPTHQQYLRKTPKELRIKGDYVRWRGKDRLVLAVVEQQPGDVSGAVYKIVVAGEGMDLPIWGIGAGQHFEVRPDTATSPERKRRKEITNSSF